MRTAKQIFEDELSGEPLTQESVIEAIQIARNELLKEIDDYLFTCLGDSLEYAQIYDEYIDLKLTENYER